MPSTYPDLSRKKILPFTDFRLKNGSLSPLHPHMVGGGGPLPHGVYMGPISNPNIPTTLTINIAFNVKEPIFQNPPPLSSENGTPPPPLPCVPEAKKLVCPVTYPISLIDGPKMEAQLKISPAALGSLLSPSTLNRQNSNRVCKKM